MSNPGFPTRTGANGTPPSPPPRTRLEPFSSRGDGTRGGTNALKSALTLRKYRAGYQIRTGDLQLGKASQTFAATALPSHSSPLAVSWRPKTSRVVALEVGFQVGSFSARARAGQRRDRVRSARDRTRVLSSGQRRACVRCRVAPSSFSIPKATPSSPAISAGPAARTTRAASSSPSIDRCGACSPRHRRGARLTFDHRRGMELTHDLGNAGSRSIPSVGAELTRSPGRRPSSRSIPGVAPSWPSTLRCRGGHAHDAPSDETVPRH